MERIIRRHEVTIGQLHTKLAFAEEARENVEEFIQSVMDTPGVVILRDGVLRFIPLDVEIPTHIDDGTS